MIKLQILEMGRDSMLLLFQGLWFQACLFSYASLQIKELRPEKHKVKRLKITHLWRVETVWLPIPYFSVICHFNPSSFIFTLSLIICIFYSKIETKITPSLTNTKLFNIRKQKPVSVFLFVHLFVSILTKGL